MFFSRCLGFEPNFPELFCTSLFLKCNKAFSLIGNVQLLFPKGGLMGKGLLITLFVSAACLAQGAHAVETPVEDCGLKQPIKYMRFRHQQSIVSDISSLEFKQNGGFVFYNEDGPNHFWYVDPGNFQVRKIVVTPPKDSHTYVFTTHPSAWLEGFNSFEQDLVNVRGFVQDSEYKDASIDQIESALNCAQRIFINMLARGQEQYLNHQTLR